MERADLLAVPEHILMKIIEYRKIRGRQSERKRRGCGWINLGTNQSQALANPMER
jgi:hypothetical protein